MEKLTQSKIEDIILYAAQLGVTVLKIGVPKTILDEYNKENFASGEVIVLKNSDIVSNKSNKDCFSSSITIVALENE